MTRLLWILGGFLLFGPISEAIGQADKLPPTSLYDQRLSELRRVSLDWERKGGPERKVVDQVVMVPDIATFFEAIAAWDDGSFFPILIDDADLAPKFVRAFHPSKILRYPGRPKNPEGETVWNQAIMAVGKGWTTEFAGPPAPPGKASPIRPGEIARPSIIRDLTPRGDVVPSWIAPTPPGVVVSHPASPSLAGAVALAAGRFQPLLLWEPTARVGVQLDQNEAISLCEDMETKLSEIVKDFKLLGDDCDFLTLAAPYPDRYNLEAKGLKGGPAAFDDLIGRNRETLRRWAYTGRLTGNAQESVYRAMCSLFLQPKTALLFDGYDPANVDFRPYAMKAAEVKMPTDLRVTLVDGAKADIQGWNRTMGSMNEYELILINTHGSQPTIFHLTGNTRGLSGDIPTTVPSVVLAIHSFSAAAPEDANTMAGAWLTGGAYLYFGSLYEPYLTAFRTPSLIASLFGEGIPISAVVRLGPDENPMFGTPWRLHLLGDPLFRLNPEKAPPRSPTSENTQNWPLYVDESAPPATAPATTKLAWAAKTTLIDAAKSSTSPLRETVEGILLGMRREQLPVSLRPILDDLRIDAMPRSRAHQGEYLTALASVPIAEMSPRVSQSLLHGRTAKFRRALERSDWVVLLNTWEEIERSTAPVELKEQATKDAGALASKANHLITWKARINALLEGKKETPETKHLRDELARVLKATGKTSAGTSIRRGE